MSPVAEMMTDTRNEAFRAFVDRLAAGRSSRELSRLTREAGLYVNPTTIGDMRFGIVPGYKLLERFAAALALEPCQKAEMFRLAGYTLEGGARLGHADERGPLSNAERLTAHIADLARRYPEIPNLTISLQGGLGRLHELSEEEMVRLLASVTRNAERLAEKKRSKQTETQA